MGFVLTAEERRERERERGMEGERGGEREGGRGREDGMDGEGERERERGNESNCPVIVSPAFDLCTGQRGLPIPSWTRMGEMGRQASV